MTRRSQSVDTVAEWTMHATYIRHLHHFLSFVNVDNLLEQMIIRRRYENYAQHSSWIRCIECLAAALQSSFDVLVSALDDHTNIPGSFNSIWPQECIMSLLPRHCMLTANACMAICPQGFVIKHGGQDSSIWFRPFAPPVLMSISCYCLPCVAIDLLDDVSICSAYFGVVVNVNKSVEQDGMMSTSCGTLYESLHYNREDECCCGSDDTTCVEPF